MSESFFLFFCVLLITNASIAQPARTKYNFNSSWKVFVGDAKGADAVNFDDASWKKLPCLMHGTRTKHLKKISKIFRTASPGIASILNYLHRPKAKKFF